MSPLQILVHSVMGDYVESFNTNKPTAIAVRIVYLQTNFIEE